MRNKPPATRKEDAFTRLRREVREGLGEFVPPLASGLANGGRPQTDAFPGRPREYYIRLDVEQWIATQVEKAKAAGVKMSPSQVVNDVLRREMRRSIEEARWNKYDE